MKSNCLFIILLLINSITYCQIIKGSVIDKKTKQPIIFASVFFDGTSHGTTTNLEGYFELDISSYSYLPITISAIGYKTQTCTEFYLKKENTIVLMPKVFELNEVVVKIKSLVKKRKKNIRLFKEIFLGATESHCKILNEEVLRFDYDNKDSLKAWVSEPLKIHNEYLGYLITYDLHKFEYDRDKKTFFFKGYTFFSQDSAATNTKNIDYVKRRKSVYKGSRMHFIRSLWLNTLKDAGFKVTDPYGDFIDIESLVSFETSGKTYVNFIKDQELQIHYAGDISSIIFKKNRVRIFSSGYTEPNGFFWQGVMVNQRIAHMLPFDYQHYVSD